MKIFITGSSDGIGQLAAMKLIDQGHDVVLHARNDARGQQALNAIPNAKKVLIGDLSSIEQTKKLASEVNKLGPFDAIIHNAGVNRTSNKLVFDVNCLAPYILTSLIQKPKRLIFIGSGMHLHASPNLKNISKGTDYSSSKLYLLLLANAVARKWPEVYSNTVNPGWVPTKMGGRSASDDLQKGAETQVWLAVSDDEKVKVTGKYFFHQKEVNYNKHGDDIDLQDKFLESCAQICGIDFPTN